MFTDDEIAQIGLRLGYTDQGLAYFVTNPLASITTAARYNAIAATLAQLTQIDSQLNSIHSRPVAVKGVGSVKVDSTSQSGQLKREASRLLAQLSQLCNIPLKTDPYGQGGARSYENL